MKPSIIFITLSLLIIFGSNFIGVYCADLGKTAYAAGIREATGIQCMLTILQSDGPGSTTPAMGNYTYIQGTSVQVTAAPIVDWQFSHWLLDGVDTGSSNPIMLTLNTTHTLRAVFTQTGDEWVTLLDLNYLAAGKAPPSIIYNLTPTVKCRYTVELSWSGDGLNLGIGGVNLRCYSNYLRGVYFDESNTIISAFVWNLGTNRTSITIDTDTVLGKANITTQNYRAELPYYRAFWYEDKSANTFTPDTISLAPVNSAEIVLYRVTQQVKAPSLAIAIGSNKYQAFGYDGPHAASTVAAGMNEINAAKMRATIFADVDYIRDTSYLKYLKGLISGGWELGIHFSKVLTNMTWTDARAEMISEYATISQAFGTPPLTWCILGVGGFDDQTQTQWVKDNLNMIFRGYRTVPQSLSGSHDMVNSNFNYWLEAAKAGVQTIPVYVHETEVEPALSFSVDASKFDTWLSYIKNSSVCLTGYYEWYMINSNQLDAALTINTIGATTTITSDTNGYNAIILVKIKACKVASVMCGNQTIPYSESQEGYTVFEVADGRNYTVSVGYSLTLNTMGQGVVTKTPSQSAYVAGSTVQLTASPASRWVFSNWSNDLSSSDNPVTVTMNGEKNVTANFNQSPYTEYTLTITQPDGPGSTTPAPGNYTYSQGTIVQVNATPESGWTLDHWLLDNVDIGNSNPYTFNISMNHVLKAIFKISTYSLTVQTSGSGSTNHLGKTIQDADSEVMVSANASIGWKLDHWELNGTSIGNANPYQITMNNNYVLKAVFIQNSVQNISSYAFELLIFCIFIWIVTTFINQNSNNNFKRFK